jgi:hypothetical protein
MLLLQQLLFERCARRSRQSGKIWQRLLRQYLYFWASKASELSHLDYAYSPAATAAAHPGAPDLCWKKAN